jgi:DNA-binding NarL/FixJ family response regulator
MIQDSQGRLPGLFRGEETAPAAGSQVLQLRLMLVDDHVILREGLRALLELEPGLKVVGEAGSVNVALQLAPDCRPDIVLTDIGLPGLSGLSLATELRKLCPGVRIILLTAYASEEYIRAGLDARADGYVLKDSGHAELLAAIHSVARGKQFLCKAVADTVLANYINRDEDGAARNPLQSVTLRERQVLSRIASGQSNKIVARELKLSVKTVEKHRANLMRKLALHNAADITRFALRHKLIARDGGEPLPHEAGDDGPG